MRKIFALGAVMLIGVALVTFAGALFPEGSFLNEMSQGIRALVSAIGDSIAGSVRGVG